MAAADSPSWKTGEAVVHVLVAVVVDVAVICVELMWKIGGMEGGGGGGAAAPELADTWSSERKHGHYHRISSLQRLSDSVTTMPQDMNFPCIQIMVKEKDKQAIRLVLFVLVFVIIIRSSE